MKGKKMPPQAKKKKASKPKGKPTTNPGNAEEPMVNDQIKRSRKAY